nr:D(1)-like dopamine receptor [Lytechinus pictus]
MDLNNTSTSSLTGSHYDYQELGLLELLQMVVFCLLGLLTVVFNLFLFAVLKRGKDIFDDVTVLLFRSLATTDICTGLTVSVLEGIVFYFRDFPYSYTACMYMPFACSCMIFSSLVHVCLMNLQRFTAVSYPFLYLRIASVKRVRITLGVTKIIIICISLILLPLDNFPLKSIFETLCESRSFFSVVIDKGALSTAATASLIFLALLTAIPVVVLTYTNVRLLILASKKRRGRPDKLGNQPRKLNASVNGEGSKTRCACRRLPKGLRTVVVITFLFYISIAPFLIALSALLFQPSWSETGYDVIYFISVFAIISSCWWNVPVYILTSVSFRKRALLMLRRVCHLRPKEGPTGQPSSADTFNESTKQAVQS